MGIAAQVILVVDDDWDMLHTAQRILSRVGYSVITASGPLEALKKSRDLQGDIDLLLTDVVMPEMDGVTLAEQVLVERPNIRVLLMSGFAPLRSRFSLITKPYRMTQLFEEVSRTIAGPPPLPSYAGTNKDSTNASVRAVLATELNEAIRRYLEESRSFLGVVSDVPSGIPNPDGVARLKRPADAMHRAFEEYQRARTKLDEHIKAERGRIEPEPER